MKLNPYGNFGFYKLPICLLESNELKTSEIVLYSVMLSRYTLFSNQGKIYCDSYEKLAEKSNMARSSVASALRVLRELGLVEIDKKVKAKNNLFNKNIWKVNSVFPVNGKLPVAAKSKESTETTEAMTDDFIASSAFLESYEWRKLRIAVLSHYGKRCMCCGAEPGDGVIMNVDHIRPRKTYPELALEFDNLQVLCNVCNHGKGNWSTHDFRPTQTKEDQEA